MQHDFFNNIIILFSYFLFKNTKMILKIGVKWFFFLLFLIIIKFILPFEFFFTKQFLLKEFYLQYIFLFIRLPFPS